MTQTVDTHTMPAKEQLERCFDLYPDVPAELVAVIGWGQRTLSTVYRHCNYFDSNQQCRFCDMNGNVKAVKETGYHLTIHKKPEQIAEVLRELFVEQPADEPRRRVMQLNHWVIEPTAALTGNKQPPLDYYVQICQAWYQMWKKNQGPAPRGYPMGPGQSTHHVSALLDVGA